MNKELENIPISTIHEILHQCWHFKYDSNYFELKALIAGVNYFETKLLDEIPKLNDDSITVCMNDLELISSIRKSLLQKLQLQITINEIHQLDPVPILVINQAYAKSNMYRDSFDRLFEMPMFNKKPEAFLSLIRTKSVDNNCAHCKRLNCFSFCSYHAEFIKYPKCCYCNGLDTKDSKEIPVGCSKCGKLIQTHVFYVDPSKPGAPVCINCYEKEKEGDSK